MIFDSYFGTESNNRGTPRRQTFLIHFIPKHMPICILGMPNQCFSFFFSSQPRYSFKTSIIMGGKMCLQAIRVHWKHFVYQTINLDYIIILNDLVKNFENVFLKIGILRCSSFPSLDCFTLICLCMFCRTTLYVCSGFSKFLNQRA